MRYITNLVEDINQGIKEQEQGDPFKEMPKGTINCACYDGLKVIRKICKSGEIPVRTQQVKRHACDKPHVAAAYWRKLDEHEDGNITGQCLLFVGTQAAVDAA